MNDYTEPAVADAVPVLPLARRRSIRLKGYDYSRTGAYFVTVCTQGRECLFGDVVDGEMRLNALGEIIRQCWMAIADHFPRAWLDEFVVMPNHLHGIVALTDSPGVGATHASPLPVDVSSSQPRGPRRQSVASIVGSFKSAATKRINEQRGTAGMPVWQRNYYEHIIRDEASLHRIREYIVNNPLQWALDRENPHIVGATHASPLHRASPRDDEPWRV